MTSEYIRLSADTNYIRQKWVVIDCTVGTTTATTFLWVKAASYGFDTEENLLAFKRTSEGYMRDLDASGRMIQQNPYTGVDKTGLVGTLGEYRVVKLSDVAPFSRGGKIDFVPNIELG